MPTRDDGLVDENLPEVDTSAANAARIDDYMLGGAHHSARGSARRRPAATRRHVVDGRHGLHQQ